MTVESTNNRISYAGTGSVVAFAFPYRFFVNEDLKVILVDDTTNVETLQVLDTDYTVAGADVEAGGTVTMMVAPPTGTTLVIIRELAITQGLDLVENDSLPAEEVERAHDRSTMQIQQVSTEVSRAAKLPEGYTGAFTGELPTPVADTALVFDATAENFIVGPSVTDIADAATNATAAAASASAASTSASNAATSAATAQAAASGMRWKDRAVVATTANITLSGEQTIDGVLTAADRVLVKDQTNTAENGMYVSASGAWSRSDDYNSWDEVPSAVFAVEVGSTYADTSWICISDSGGILGVTDINFNQFGSGTVQSVVAGSGLSGGTITSSGTIAVDINSEIAATVASGDEILIADVSDSNNIKKTTAQEIANLNTSVQLEESPAYAITGAGHPTPWAHGFGKKPFIVQGWLRCLTAEHGYSIGDETPLGGGAISEAPTSNHAGIAMIPDATQVYVRFGLNVSPNTLIVNHKTTGATSGITNSNWEFFMKAIA